MKELQQISVEMLRRAAAGRFVTTAPSYPVYHALLEQWHEAMNRRRLSKAARAAMTDLVVLAGRRVLDEEAAQWTS